MSKKKKFTKKHYLFIGIGIFFTIIILGAFVDDQEQVAVSKEPIKNSFTAFVSEQAVVSPRIAKIQNDPDFQDWLEIEKRTVPFKKEKKWLKETFEWLRVPTKKWCPAWEKNISSYIDKIYPKEAQYKPYKTDEELFEDLHKELDWLKNELRDVIVNSIYYKGAVGLQVSAQDFEKFAGDYGFNFPIESDWDWNPSWTSYSFYQDGVFENGRKKGKGLNFNMKQDQSGKIIEILIPINQVDVDFYNLPSDPHEKWIVYKKAVQASLSEPMPWARPSLDLLFGEPEQTIIVNKIMDIVNADDDGFKNIFSAEDPLPFSWKGCSFPVGDKWVSCWYLANGVFFRVVTAETHEIENNLDEDQKAWKV